MATSEVEICNLALSFISEDSISTLGSSNKRERLCKANYLPAVRFVLSRFDWPFARSIARLNKDASSNMYVPEGKALYLIPSNCVRPLAILPETAMSVWEQLGSYIMTDNLGDLEQDMPILKFTRLETNTLIFSETFTSILSEHLAARLIGPLKGEDAKVVSAFAAKAEQSFMSLISVDANIGSEGIEIEGSIYTDTFSKTW